MKGREGIGLLGFLLAAAVVTTPAAATSAAAAAAVAAVAGWAGKAPAGVAAESQSYGRFGRVAIYRRSPHPHNVVVLVSGETGLDRQAAALAQSLSALDTLVVELDLAYYLRKSNRSQADCAYPAGDLEMLSKMVQLKLGRPHYTPPVLAGLGSGGTLVYAALAQAPTGTFLGAISFGFCPDLAINHPFCAGRGLVSKAAAAGQSVQVQPAASLPEPWIVVQGEASPRCTPQSVQDFTRRVQGAVLVPAPAPRRPAAAAQRLSSPAKQSLLRVLNAADLARVPETPVRKSLPDLPLLELPVPGATVDTLAVIVSGDGGWAGLDRDLARVLAEKGVPVVGLNSLQYFWTPRNPDGAAADLERILRTYLAAWNRQKALLIGYSLGAEVLPFMANRLPADLLDRVRLVALLGPNRTTSFEFRLSEWLGHGGGEERPVLPEVAKLKPRQVFCLYGGGEKEESLCPLLGQAGVAVELPGAHYLGGDYRAVADAVIAHAVNNEPPAPAAAPAPSPPPATAPAPSSPPAAAGPPPPNGPPSR
ncbi:MAG TPA: AcvB/VirJ family lysyl-phosphatidylglycerol hydrolase [Thermoanaerobaculia bacterium]|nr:AcvB/VirJ family lysyl-phosphatidylglycerol hydrolase [Thermoanaerobaculia bacterium]